MPLRPYQLYALENLSQQFLARKRSVLLVSPCGSGKTAMGVEVARRALAKGRKVLWLAHRTELINQASERMTSEGLPRHGIMQAGRANHPAPLQIASVDTLKARGCYPPADLIIWDEAHHCNANGWATIHKAYPNAWHLGLTATPCRADGAALGDIFESMVVATSVKELTRLGHLVPARIEAPTQRLDPGQLAQCPVNAYTSRALGKKALVYVSTVAEAQDLTRQFRDALVDARMVCGETPDEERSATITSFKSPAGIEVLVNVGVLTEGTDLPNAEVCILARGVGSLGLWLQIVGRVLRPAPGKTHALILDLAGSVHDHGLPDEDHVFSLEGSGIRKAKEEGNLHHCRKCQALSRSYPCASCGYTPELLKPHLLHSPLLTIDEWQSDGRMTPTKEKSVIDALTRECAERGRKIGWIIYYFEAKYGYKISKQRFCAARKYYQNLKATPSLSVVAPPVSRPPLTLA